MIRLLALSSVFLLSVASIPNEPPIVFAGDSLSVGYSMYTKNSINVAKTSSGLIARSFYDIPASLNATCTKGYTKKAVILSVGSNDTKSISGEKIGSDRWNEAYSKLLDEALESASRCNVKVVLVLPPPFTGKLENDVQIIRNVLKTKCDTSIICVDPAVVFGSAEFVRHVDGKQVRSGDNVHMTAYGYRLISNYIVGKVYE